jgi:chemotaxis protein methyltransferase CheR
MLESDDSLLHEFMDRVTINVSELFRNPEQYRILRERIIPDLLKRSNPLRVWSAGCSYGQEPYSLAICLEEAAPGKRHSIFASDIDDRALASAQRGVFSQLDAKSVDREHRARWFTEDGDNLIADDHLKDMIHFGKVNLLKDSFTTGYDLIVCRNVVIYFTEEAKARLYSQFFASLKPGGYLFVGGTERISGHAEIGYTNPYPFFYHKPLVRQGESVNVKTHTRC